MIASLRRRSMVMLAFAAGCATATLAGAQTAPRPDAAKGQQIASQLCAACHGADGNSTISANPRLAQQHAEYLYKQLVDYTVRDGQKQPARINAIMNGIAASLSDADKRNVAAWYASQPAKPASARNKELLELGQRVYRAGVADKGLPSCFGCHNPAGQGIPSQYPRLSGQHAEYSEATLKAFRDGTRRNSVAMEAISAKLSDSEMRAVAEYVQGLRR